MTDPALAVLLRQLDLAFDHTSWHGPNLRGAVRRVTAAEAAWRPTPDRRSVAEQVLHAAYWKYTVRRRLTGEKRGSFALKGSNWFPQPEPFGEADWRRCVELLLGEHATLRAAVAALDPRQLSRRIGSGRFTVADTVLGVAAHDLYHAGQVQLLRRLYADSPEARR
ncbi:MAG TPA: DinB family protein [Gemmataceae bacterium]